MAGRGIAAAGDTSARERSVGREALRACRRFCRGEVIFHVDDPGDSLFVVTEGSVKIVVPPHDGRDLVIPDPARLAAAARR